MLVAQSQSSPNALLRQVVRGSMPGVSDPYAGDEFGAHNVHQGAEEPMTNVSAEDMVSKMSDDELLFGRPLTAVSEHEQFDSRKTLSMSASASYREKAEVMGQKRWQMLYSEAEDRHRGSNMPQAAPTDSRLSTIHVRGSTSEAMPIFNQDSQDLISHARHVRNSLWREAIGSNDLPSPTDASGSPVSPERERGARSLSIVGSPTKSQGQQQGWRQSQASPEPFSVAGEASLRHGGVGGAAVSMPTQSGSVHLGRPKPSLKIEAGKAQSAALAHMLQSRSSLSELLGQDPLSPATKSISGYPSGSISSERTMSPDTAAQAQAQAQRSGRSQVRDSLQHGGGGQRDSLRRQQERVPRRVPSRSPDHSPPRDAKSEQQLFFVANSSGSKEKDQAYLSTQNLSLSGGGQENRHSSQPRPLVGSPSKMLSRRSMLKEAPSEASTMLPFDDLEIGGSSNWNNMPKHETKLHGMWMRSMSSKTSTGESGDLRAAIEAELGSGLPQCDPIVRVPRRKPGGLKTSSSASSTLPSLPSTPERRVGRKRANQSEAKMNLSASMPDLSQAMMSSALALPLLSDRGAASVKTPPLAGEEKAMASPKQQKRGKKSIVADKSAGADGNAPPFEAPLLYVGNPPPAPGSEEAKRLSGSWTGAHSTGASHTIPIGLRKSLMKAAIAFELGDHVQRHATDSADTAAELGIPPLVHRALVPSGDAVLA